MRRQLLLGPVTFDTNADVLDDLRSRVPSWKLDVAGRRSLVASWRWIHRERPTTDLHKYKLYVDLVNNGLERIDEWRAEIWFPAAHIEEANTKDEFVYMKESDTDYSPEARRIWPGDPPRPTFNIDYFVNDDNWPRK